jgi:hypothetical protein
MSEKTPASLLAEAVATYNEIDRRFQVLLKGHSAGKAARLRARLRRAKERAWNRYLRRWVNQEEVEWFEPWLPQNESTNQKGV